MTDSLDFSPTAANGADHQGAVPATPLVIVTGKGGVGRSSAATAIAVALAERGGRVALVHPVEAKPVRPPASAPPGLVVVPLDRKKALSNYLGDQLPGPFAAGLRASRAFQLITAATPGLAELLTIGELRRMTEGAYDHLVFDAPATGHLLALLDAPGRFERAAAVGPIAARARQLGEWIADPAITATVTVTTGDSLAVSELLDLITALESRLGHGPSLVIANRLAPPSPPAAELALLAEREGDAVLADAVLALEHLATRARSERAQLGRVTRQVGLQPIRAYEQPGEGVRSVLAALAGEGPVLSDEPGISAQDRRRAERRTRERRTEHGEAA
ncbi:MAG: hypothetical protein JHC74_15060 [Thermoleophilia bacterium]|nr:hypothetical protein [Thermoleophilia bacterium]